MTRWCFFLLAPAPARIGAFSCWHPLPAHTTTNESLHLIGVLFYWHPLPAHLYSLPASNESFNDSLVHFPAGTHSPPTSSERFPLAPDPYNRQRVIATRWLVFDSHPASNESFNDSLVSFSTGTRTPTTSCPPMSRLTTCWCVFLLAPLPGPL